VPSTGAFNRAWQFGFKSKRSSPTIKPTQVTVGGSGSRHGAPRAQSRVDFRERGSPVRNFVPALHHQGVDPRGTRLGARQQLSRPDHVDHFLVAVPIIWLKHLYLIDSVFEQTQIILPAVHSCKSPRGRLRNSKHHSQLWICRTILTLVASTWNRMIASMRPLIRFAFRSCYYLTGSNDLDCTL